MHTKHSRLIFILGAIFFGLIAYLAKEFLAAIASFMCLICAIEK